MFLEHGKEHYYMFSIQVNLPLQETSNLKYHNEISHKKTLFVLILGTHQKLSV